MPEEANPFEDVKSRNAVDFMLRTTQQNHMHLSAMADQKAHIIIAATSVIFTISAGFLTSTEVLWGLLSLCGFCLVSLTFSVLSVTPIFRITKTSRTWTHFNPLFFGHFTEMDRDQYFETLNEIVRSDGKIYKALANDIYQNGKILKERKYKYLGLSYQAFFIGILISGILFVVQMIIRNAV